MGNISTQIIWCCIVSFKLLAFCFPDKAKAQVVLTRDMSGYAQNFNALPASGSDIWENGQFYISGWTIHRTSTTTSLLTGTGSSNMGGLYSFGQSGSTDRALGAISSGTASVGQFAWGLLIQNNTGHTIKALNISFTGEQWRSASKSAGRQATTFWHSQSAANPDFNLSPLTDLNWTPVPELDFYSLVNFSAAGALNGNLPANKAYLSSSIQVDILNGHYLMLRWKDLNDLDDDHGLAIDDFALTWSSGNEAGPVVMPVELLYFHTLAEANVIKLNWATASEKNSHYFNIERSYNGINFETIASVPSKGFSSQKVNYAYHDTDNVRGTVYYRLKQVDLDETYTYSRITTVKKSSPVVVALYPTVTSGEISIELPFSLAATKLQVFDKAGRVVLSGFVPPQLTNYKLNTDRFQPGNYFVVLFDETEQRQVFKIIRK